MKSVVSVVAVGLLAVILIVGLAVFSRYAGLRLNSYFSPKEEAVRRETFEQSKAYQDGLIQDLRKLQFEYIQASPEHKPALKAIIQRRADGLGRDALPSDLYTFLRTL